SPPASRSPPGRRKARTPPGTATATWPGFSATPPPPPPAPTPSWASGTGGSPAAGAARKPSWPSAGPCWSSTGTPSANRPPPHPLDRPGQRLLPDWDRPRAPQAQPHPPARSPRLQGHPATRGLTTGPNQPGSADAPPGAAARPLTLPFSDQGGGVPARTAALP